MFYDIFVLQFSRPQEIPVYNVTCRETKRTTWKEVLELGKATAYEYPFEAGVWYVTKRFQFVILVSPQCIFTLYLHFFPFTPLLNLPCSYRYPDGDITTNKIYHTICVTLFHWLPAYFIDFLMFCFGQKRL